MHKLQIKVSAKLGTYLEVQGGWGSTPELIQAGGILVLVVVGLRSAFTGWPSVEGYSLLLEAATFLPMWPLHLQRTCNAMVKSAS
jgi:hypothetical protein